MTSIPFGRLSPWNAFKKWEKGILQESIISYLSSQPQCLACCTLTLNYSAFKLIPVLHNNCLWWDAQRTQIGIQVVKLRSCARWQAAQRGLSQWTYFGPAAPLCNARTHSRSSRCRAQQPDPAAVPLACHGCFRQDSGLVVLLLTQRVQNQMLPLCSHTDAGKKKKKKKAALFLPFFLLFGRGGGKQAANNCRNNWIAPWPPRRLKPEQKGFSTQHDPFCFVFQLLLKFGSLINTWKEDIC